MINARRVIVDEKGELFQFRNSQGQIEEKRTGRKSRSWKEPKEKRTEYIKRYKP